MRRWSNVSLGEVLRHRKEFILLDDTEYYKRCRVQLHAKGVVLRDVVLGSAIKTKRQQVCHAGEFLVAEIDAKMGGFGIVPDALEGAIVSSHYFLFEIDGSKLDRGFLDYFIRTTGFRNQVEAQGSTNYAAIRPASVLGYRMPLPPLAEQQAIVSRLDALADKVRQVNEHLDAIEKKAAALFLSLHYKLSGDRVRRLGDVVELHEEHVPVRADSEYPQVGVRSFGGGLFPKAAVAGTETSYKAFNRLYVDALVLSQVKGWEGALALCPTELAGMYVSPEYRTFRCVPGEAMPAYIGELVRTPWFWSLLQEATRGVGARRERTRPEQFLNIELPMPPENMQRKVVEILARQSSLRLRHTTIRQANDALIPAMLERVFSEAH
ncbi:restriction endonuclease subunit S [Caldimonas taiwanensis]|uniref:restriction endonuclease subunit S n=1 Tax=Caldimonas taiwanensis TaxID=307483 RepID=UPI000783ACE7|nr:restriction endonuclease subunit S [Caldimonas taiwanensis]